MLKLLKNAKIVKKRTLYGCYKVEVNMGKSEKKHGDFFLTSPALEIIYNGVK